MSSFLLCTQGSLGDLHPMLGIGRELLKRGHRVRLATNPYYEQKVRREELEFAPVGPRLDPEDRELIERTMDPRRGSEYVMRELVVPHIRDSFEDTLKAAEDIDLLVSSPITPYVRLVAESTRTPWASATFSPISFWSRSDPPAVPPLAELVEVPWVGPLLMRAVMWVGRWWSRRWFAEYDHLREELGLPSSGHPMLEGQHSPYLVLALFSGELAAPEPAWPDRVVQPGFVFYDRGESGGDEELEAFLEEGEPPVVVTLGSAACLTDRAAGVFESALEVARRRSGRVLLITGPRHYVTFRRRDDKRVLTLEYAPYSEVFPEAKLLVHQGGAGTVGQAMRSGTPMVVAPFAHDQYEHARRLKRRGLGVTVPATKFSNDRLQGALDRLVGEPSFRRTARQVAANVSSEPGAAGAADALESVLETNTARPSLPAEKS